MMEADLPLAASPVPVWDIYKALTEECRHFNALESTYRTFASTWLLATFGGIGFILKETPTAHPLLLVAGVSAAGALGIHLLWLMDIMVYHRLLTAVFAEQLLLEGRYARLPQTAHGMMAVQDGAGVLPKVVWFYVAPYTLLVLAASLAIGQGLPPQCDPITRVAAGTASFLLLGYGVAWRIRNAGTTVVPPEVRAFHHRRAGRRQTS